MGPHFSPGRETLEMISGFLFPKASLALHKIAAAPATLTPPTSLAPPSQVISTLGENSKLVTCSCTDTVTSLPLRMYPVA
eukprot:2359190-Heterocapsa_arctica.AAC.1